MKDYIQVSESVFRKAEERMAEKKRHSMKVKRNTLAATSAAAVLFVVLMQNEEISNAIKSFPKFVSSVWSGDEPTTTQMTTQPTVTTTAAVTTTQAVTDTTETTTEETTTTTTTTTTQPVTTETPIVTTVSPIDGLPRMRLGSWSEEIVATTNDTLTFANGMTINFAYGSPDFRNKFSVGDEIIYSGSFAYDKSNKIYYYLSEGRFEKCGGLSVQSAYHEEQETEKTTEYHNDNNNDDDQYDDYEEYPEDYDDYEDDDYEEYVDKPFEYVDDGTPAMDYAEIINDPDFEFQDRNFYKLKVNGIKVKSKEGAYIISEDGQKWIFSTHSLSGMTESEVYGIKEGDVLNMEGYFYYLAFDGSIYNLEMKIEKVK